MSVQRWTDEHSARKAPIGAVLYDDDDDLFTVKTKPGEWVTYSRDRLPFAEPLNDRDIDGDRGDQLVGELELPVSDHSTRRKPPGAAECGRCHRFGYIDELSGWCQECLCGPLPVSDHPNRRKQP